MKLSKLIVNKLIKTEITTDEKVKIGALVLIKIGLI